MVEIGFMFFSMMSSADSMSQIHGSKFYWKVGYKYESLEPLIDF